MAFVGLNFLVVWVRELQVVAAVIFDVWLVVRVKDDGTCGLVAPGEREG